MRTIRVLRAGMVEHSVVSREMKRLQKDRIEDLIPDTLIIVEHPEVVTIGPKARRDGVSVDGYPTSETDRGGGITWHGPGQLVVYPIIKWELEEQSVRGIIGLLEDWAIASLESCGVVSYKDSTMQGAWVDGHKICSIGLSFLHWVSRHGMSININTPGTRVEDLEGCGMVKGTHTSLHQLGYSHDKDGRPIDIRRFEDALLETCEGILNRSPQNPESWVPEVLA
ncbi:MAG: lipoyl(octanoyl) transferase [Euryarchaeota archaeon]|nr:lipoyl(octanoyl) transferase [Euryarchaeota archaeon]|tara:strand:+ start:101 stop:775 length:675 start_codon:yes stop_codon:yes gene_type:complete